VVFELRVGVTNKLHVHVSNCKPSVDDLVNVAEKVLGPAALILALLRGLANYADSYKVGELLLKITSDSIRLFFRAWRHFYDSWSDAYSALPKHI